MTSQVAITSKNFPAGGAIVRLDIGVGEQVGLQIGSLVEGAIAHWALMRRLLHMQDLVDSQSSGLTESLAAFGALEGLLLGVDVSVKYINKGKE